MSIDQLNHHEFRASHGAFRTWHVGGLVAVVVCDVADGLSLHSSSDFLICDQVSAAAEGPWSDPREPDLPGALTTLSHARLRSAVRPPPFVVQTPVVVIALS